MTKGQKVETLKGQNVKTSKGLFGRKGNEITCFSIAIPAGQYTNGRF